MYPPCSCRYIHYPDGTICIPIDGGPAPGTCCRHCGDYKELIAKPKIVGYCYECRMWSEDMSEVKRWVSKLPSIEFICDLCEFIENKRKTK